MRRRGRSADCAGGRAAAFEALRALAALVPSSCFEMDPIDVLEAMADAGSTHALSPLIYGYVSYATKGFRQRPLQFQDIASVGDKGRPALPSEGPASRSPLSRPRQGRRSISPIGSQRRCPEDPLCHLRRTAGARCSLGRPGRQRRDSRFLSCHARNAGGSLGSPPARWLHAVPAGGIRQDQLRSSGKASVGRGHRRSQRPVPREFQDDLTPAEEPDIREEKEMKSRLNGLLAATALVLCAQATQAQDAVETVVSGLPEPLKAQYEVRRKRFYHPPGTGFTPRQSLGSGAIRNPIRANPWRVTVTKELQRLVEGLIEKGTVASFEVSDSTMTSVSRSTRSALSSTRAARLSPPFPARQPRWTTRSTRQQRRAFRLSRQPGPSRARTRSMSIQLCTWGYDMMSAIGTACRMAAAFFSSRASPATRSWRRSARGGDKALAENAKLKVARSVNGNWTANVTKTVVFQPLHQSGPDRRGLDDGEREPRRGRSLRRSRPSGAADHRFADRRRPCLLKANPDKFRFEGHALLPHWTAQTLFRVGARMLDGQKPKLNTLMIRSGHS